MAAVAAVLKTIRARERVHTPLIRWSWINSALAPEQFSNTSNAISVQTSCGAPRTQSDAQVSFLSTAANQLPCHTICTTTPSDTLGNMTLDYCCGCSLWLCGISLWHIPVLCVCVYAFESAVGDVVCGCVLIKFKFDRRAKCMCVWRSAAHKAQLIATRKTISLQQLGCASRVRASAIFREIVTCDLCSE